MKLTRRQLLLSAGGSAFGISTVAAGTGLYGGYFETEWLDVTRVSIPMPGLPEGLDGFRIVLLSDFHLFPHTRIEFIRQVIERANTFEPDLIALTGDFVQGDVNSIFELAPALASLNARYGIYSILGNHDHWKGKTVVEQGLAEEGLELLTNRGISLPVGGNTIYLAGVDDCWSGQPDLQAALADCPTGATTILLSHEPDPADSYSKDPRIALQLSGHSHGGQVRIPFWGSPFLPPFGRVYDQGLFRVGEMWLYTNRGVGVTVPIRLNCRPELTILTLNRDVAQASRL
jgi:predicted MPP superfamily phosphohydrolase